MTRNGTQGSRGNILEQSKIVVLDFGGQYSHLIARRIRECRVYSELLPYDVQPNKLRKVGANGIILSGGPASVYDRRAPMCSNKIFNMGLPVLGICYGLQLIVHKFGGKVKKVDRREYGRSSISIDDSSDLFKNLGTEITAWMSHSDQVTKLPLGFSSIAHSLNSPVAAIRDSDKRLFGVQFHPEVMHTPKGLDIIRNFTSVICRCEPSWTMASFVEKTVQQISEKVSGDRAICALSGGVDSSTAAVLAQRALGDRLVCMFVDHGLLRKDEAQQVVRTFRDLFKLNVIHVKASSLFLRKLKGVTSPERKRKIIGEEFIRIFTLEGKKLGKFKWLIQGTLYPDVIESAKTGSVASRIKTHHNVAGLPGWMKFNLLEPLRWLYKDEVREVASILGLPKTIVKRHPFPGPGLAVRIIGEITPEKIRICRDAGHIVEEEIEKAGLYDKVWEAFAFVGDDKAVGVLGDERKFGHIVTLRVVESTDAMTADWTRLPHDLLNQISNRITNEVQGVTWVTYAVSSKPPSTIEPC